MKPHHSSLRWGRFSRWIYTCLQESDLRQISGRLLIIITSVCLAGGAVAQDLKIGFVDTARVLKEAPQADIARKKLENEFAPRDKKIVDMQI